MPTRDIPPAHGRQALPREPGSVIDPVPRERLCDCCAGSHQRNFEPLRYRPLLKLWLCRSCREIHEPELTAEDAGRKPKKKTTRPDRTGSAKVVSVRTRRGPKGGSKK